MDVQSLKQNIDLLELIGRDTRLKKVARTAGGEWAGPCPFCGGKDRLRVQPERGLWWCRQCGGEHWQDAIAYVMRRNNQDFKSALAALGGVGAIAGSFCPAQPTSSEQDRIEPPGAAWQSQARALLAQAQAALWSEVGTRAIAWLHARGLTDETIQSAQLGYNPIDRHSKLSDWGLSQDNRKHTHTLWIPRGIVIPCELGGVVWYINIRRPVGEPKYVKVKGSVRALYPAGWLTGKPDLFLTEGEFDALLLHQVAGDLVDVATLGGATTPLDDIWLPYLLPARRIFLCHDNDEAGRQAVVALGRLSPHTRRWRPLGAHDITDMHQAGGDLRAWVELAISGGEREPSDLASYVTLTWPADTPIGCPTGRWRRLADGRIQATYTRTELAWALVIAGSNNPAVLAELNKPSG